AMAGHACSCAAVGRSNARRNHSRTCGVNVSRAAEGMRPSSVTTCARRSGGALQDLRLRRRARGRRAAHFCRWALHFSLPVLHVSLLPSLDLPVALSVNFPCAAFVHTFPDTLKVFFEPSLD